MAGRPILVAMTDLLHRSTRRRRRPTPQLRPRPEERNPTMDATHELVAALSTDLDATGVELDEVKEAAS